MTGTNLVNKESTEVSTPETTRAGVHYTPRVDIYETDDELCLLCDMPGIKPDNIDVRYEKDELTIHGKIEPRIADEKFLVCEYGVGDYFRAFRIGAEIKADQISAEYKHGVLTIHLPKKDEVKPKRIAIKAD